MSRRGLAMAWVAAASALGLLLMAYDKRQAVQGRRRVAERTLLTVALIGGTPGVLAGMWLMRHKTRKPLFRLGLPVLLALQGWATGTWFGW